MNGGAEGKVLVLVCTGHWFLKKLSLNSYSLGCWASSGSSTILGLFVQLFLPF